MSRSTANILHCVVLCAFFISFSGSARAQSQFVYVNDYAPANTVSAFSVNIDGSLARIPGSPFLTGGTAQGLAGGATPTILAGSQRPFLFVSNSISLDISVFSIDTANGRLIPVPHSPFAVGGNGDIAMAISPDDRFLFAVANFTNQLLAFRVAADGELSPVGRPVALPSGVNGMTVSPDSRFLLLSTLLGGGFGQSQIAAYRIDPSGNLGAVPGTPITVQETAGLDMNCGTNLLFEARATAGFSSVNVFATAHNGGLTVIPGSPFSFGPGLNSFVPLLAPDEKTLFVSNPFSDSVTAMQVASDGSLSAVPGSPFAVHSNGAPTGLAVDAKGRFLFTANPGGQPISLGAFTISSSGALTAVPGSPFPTNPDGDAVGVATFPHRVCAQPIVGLSSLTLAFSPIQVGSSSAPHIVTITNRGVTPLKISTFVTAGDFAEISICGGALAPGASCNLGVIFTPTAVGTRTGSITINDNAPSSPEVITLSGVGK